MLYPDLHCLPDFTLFEDTLAASPTLMLLHEPVARHEAATQDELATVWEGIDAACGAGQWVAVEAHYELGQALEPAAGAGATDATAPAGCLLRARCFRGCLRLQGADVEAFWQQQLAGLSAQQREAGLLSLAPLWPEAEYTVACRRILDLIHAGDCYQVNLTMPFEGCAYGHPLALYRRLRALQPVRYSTLQHAGAEWVLSLSPELFMQREGRVLTCKPMKGTAPRHRDARTDAAEAAALLASEKNRAENLMIVDLIRNDLGRLVPAGGVHTRRLFELESYATVHQLTSTIEAAPVEAGLRGIFAAMFPCGSITGAPKIRAMQIIAALEPAPRGLYCGALGWVAPAGDFRFSVPIRTLRVDAALHCTLNAGGGIVADSDPAGEYRECLVKTRFASQLTEEIRLIETLRWQRGEGFPLLAGHLRRLSGSAAALGFRFSPERLHAALLAHVAASPAEALRVRVLLGHSGVEIQSFPLEAVTGAQTATLATERLIAEDPRLQHKTTARHFYDEALRQAVAGGHFDTIFLNTRGEVCEGARTNVFIERDGQLLTPPLACGLLPGVLRADLLARGRACERVLRESDLRAAPRLWLGNALRGLIRVTLA